MTEFSNPDSPTTQVLQPNAPSAPPTTQVFETPKGAKPQGTPAAIPYAAFKERMGKRDARIAGLESDLVDMTAAREAAIRQLGETQPDADQWRSYRAARLDMLKDQLPDYMESALDAQTLSEAEQTVSEFLNDSAHQPPTDSRRPAGGGGTGVMKPLSQMSSREHRDTHQSRLSHYR